MKRTRQEAEETRENILAAAERLFLKHGVEGVALEEITQAAGITRGAVQWHFQNKPGLLFALRDRMESPIEQLAERLQVDDTVDPIGSLIAGTIEVISQIQLNPKRKQLCAYLLNFSLLGEPERQRGFERLFRTSVTKVFQVAAKRGKLSEDWTPELAGIAYCGLVLGLLEQWLRGEDQFDVAHDVSAILLTFGTSLARSGRAPARKTVRRPRGQQSQRSASGADRHRNGPDQR
ncbi:MAG: TetR family transcriptional regulator [Methylacidiphilales bacterium]|nr:TetR family transcriptional regulator [Candidatus Methylacidiphilales bacterium]